MAESPEGWNLLTSSIAVCDLQQPALVWAFLSVQGLVRDQPGDRGNFLQIVQQESYDITGPTRASRIASALRSAGIALPGSGLPDPFGKIAMERRQVVSQWVNQNQVAAAPAQGRHCIYCGAEYAAGETLCGNCNRKYPEVESPTLGKVCSRCQCFNLMTASFCERCGSRLDARCHTCGEPVEGAATFCSNCGAALTPAGDSARGTNEGLFESRLFRLFQPATDPAQVARQVDDLRAVWVSAIQDIVVLKEMLAEKGIWDEASYKRLRIRRMIADHSGAGPCPWTEYSYYAYALEEDEFLRQQLAADKEEVESFEREVEFVSKLT
ncbi:MAG TPA: zinc ribbon domain-containing protein [Blastocatellia bacterium]|nr:zinc ribbon domain-containing protein [Blastocatellia bacterium]